MSDQAAIIDITDLAAVRRITSDLQTALACLDDIVADHPDPCEPFSDADGRCVESWMDLDDQGRCTKRIAHNLLVAHGHRT